MAGELGFSRGSLVAALIIIVAAAGSAVPADRDSAPQAAAEINDRGKAGLRRLLNKPYPAEGAWRHENFAMAAYYLNEKTAEADEGILALRRQEFPAIMEEKDGQFHWHAYIQERIYFLFGHRSRFFPGRMSANAEKAILEMLWQWAAPRCRLEMTLPERDWWIWASENHHIMAWASFWGAARIFSQHPTYRDKRYDDGTTPAEMLRAFNAYFKRFARHRAAKGLLVECGSPTYSKYSVNPWYNFVDFADDPELRRRMRMLLDLYWADWAVEQLDGVRGGSRHRCYPGAASTRRSGGTGGAWFHFGLGKIGDVHPGYICAATTFYRPAPVVSALALDAGVLDCDSCAPRTRVLTSDQRERGSTEEVLPVWLWPCHAGRGEYAYVSRRPGLLAGAVREGQNKHRKTSRDRQSPMDHYYILDPAGGGIVRYSWCTPDFILGTSMVEARPRAVWSAISSQNRWEGVIFAGHPTARIFVQSPPPNRGSLYNANWSVQHRGVLIVQRLKETNAKGQRVWLDKSLKRMERGGWVFAEAPRAFAAVRVVQGGSFWQADKESPAARAAIEPHEMPWLVCKEELSPVILEVARKTDFPSFEKFQKAILANPMKFEKQRLDYESTFYDTRLTLFADYSQPPRVGGKQVDYRPRKVYDCPYIQSDFGSGVVVIRKGQQRLVLDFNTDE